MEKQKVKIDLRKVIEEMENSEILWNIKHPLYWKRTERGKIVTETAKRLGIPDTQLDDQITYIKKKFNEQEAKNIGRSGSGADDKPQTQWKWFELCLFLRKGTCIKKEASQTRFPKKAVVETSLQSGQVAETATQPIPGSSRTDTSGSSGSVLQDILNLEVFPTHNTSPEYLGDEGDEDQPEILHTGNFAPQGSVDEPLPELPQSWPQSSSDQHYDHQLTGNEQTSQPRKRKKQQGSQNLFTDQENQKCEQSGKLRGKRGTKMPEEPQQQENSDKQEKRRQALIKSVSNGVEMYLEASDFTETDLMQFHSDIFKFIYDYKK